MKEAQKMNLEEFFAGQPPFVDVVSFVNDYSFPMLVLSVDAPVGTSLVQTDALFVKA